MIFPGLFNKKKINLQRTTLFIFYSGIFLLPSALSISAIFLFTALILKYFESPRDYFKDKWNIPFLLSGIFMLISTISHFFFLSSSTGDLWDPKLSIIGLLNWIPFFGLFWGVQPFINTALDRKKLAQILISGTIPVAITGFLQYYFNFHGPFEFLNGLITWYQRPITESSGLSGLFSNPNYAGSWLNIVWPFCIACFLTEKNNLIRKNTILFILLSIGYCIVLTNSRNAWGGLIISIPLVIGIDSLIWMIPLFFVITLVLLLTISPNFQGVLQDNLRLFIPRKIWTEFSKEGFIGMDISRIGIWTYALSFIFSSPFIGYGAASFPLLLELETSFWKGHSHNIFLEISHSYGIPAALILLITILFILIISWKIIFIKSQIRLSENFFEKAWWTSFLVLLLSQLVDVQYFDGRISISFWILLAGLKNIISSKIKNYSNAD